jgi:hypothetical protein
VIALLIDANNITSVTELNDLEGAVHALGGYSRELAHTRLDLRAIFSTRKA